MLYADYFADVPSFTPNDFRRRFSMNMDLFLRIRECVREHGPWFQLKKDCVRIVEFSSLQKCTTAMRMIANLAHADGQDDYLRMSESTTIQ